MAFGTSVGRIAFPFGAGVAAALVIACSGGAPDDGAKSSAANLSSCAAWQHRVCEADSEVPGGQICVCLSNTPSLSDVASAVDPAACNGITIGGLPASTTIAVPAALQPYGCTLGTVYGNDVVWACPPVARGHVPAAIGAVGSLQQCPTGAPVCPPNAVTFCEQVFTFNNVNSPCLGPLLEPFTNWFFVWDNAYHICGNGPGTCGGLCSQGPSDPTRILP
jgi:hypothetical protein